MQGIVIRYNYDGDEARWRSVTEAFIRAIGDDGAVRGKFRYTVTTGKDGVTRTHLGRWDSDHTLSTMQSRDYFKTFSEAVQDMAGDSLQPMRVDIAVSTD